MNKNNVNLDDTNNKLIIDFNWYLIRFIHHSWIEDDPYYNIIKSLTKKHLTDYRISQYLLKKFNIYNKFDYDFSIEHKKIIFADSTIIENLALYLGMIYYEKTIRLNVLKDQRDKLVAALGLKEYLFVVSKARFILPQENIFISSNMIPWDDLHKFKDFLYITGFKLISYIFKDFSLGFKIRFLIKLDKKWSKIFNLPHDYYQLSKEQSIALIIKTFKEVTR